MKAAELAAPVWVRVGAHVALISYPMRRRLGTPHRPTWLVLGPMQADRRPRATFGAGVVDVDDAGDVSLRLTDGELPEDLAPALLEAAKVLVRQRGELERRRRA